MLHRNNSVLHTPSVDYPLSPGMDFSGYVSSGYLKYLL